jgi:hypothetical protein
MKEREDNDVPLFLSADFIVVGAFGGWAAIVALVWLAWRVL